MTYAAGTTVSVENSRAEVERLLRKRGARQTTIGADEDKGIAHVLFVLDGHTIRLELPLPQWSAFEKKDPTPPGAWQWSDSRRAKWRTDQWEQAQKERWRAVVLLLKAKLELIALGVSTIEREFLADLILPGQRETVGRLLADTIAGLASTEPGGPLLLPPAQPREAGA